MRQNIPDCSVSDGGVQDLPVLITNVQVLTEDRVFVQGGVLLENGRIRRILSAKEASETAETALEKASEKASEKSSEKAEGESPCSLSVSDGCGAYLVPGFIDLHFHGVHGDDLCDGTMEALRRIAEYEASIGVTGICPASMTLPEEELLSVLRTAAAFRKLQEAEAGNDRGPVQADLLGINMEGPFISPEKKGAQDGRYILPPDTALAERFLEASEGLVKMIAAAPETGHGALEFIRTMKDKVHVSLAHTNADYDTAAAAIMAGADHAVHLFNGMSSFSHRSPGTAGAVLDLKPAFAELIADGVHVHPAAVRTAFSALGEERIIFISDSIRAAGLGDGTCLLGGQEILVSGKTAYLKDCLPDKVLAGSVTTLPECVRTAVKEMGIPLETAVRCASENPAECLGVFHDRGSIAPGKRADLLLLGGDLRVRAVWKDGRAIEES